MANGQSPPAPVPAPAQWRALAANAVFGRRLRLLVTVRYSEWMGPVPIGRQCEVIPFREKAFEMG